MRPFSIYIHIPYCRVKCPYCDFNTYAARQWPEREYVAALVAEMEHAAADEPWRKRPVRTIYFGGGTPSLFAAQSIAAVIEAVKRLWPADEPGHRAPEPISARCAPYEGGAAIDPGTETTIEANPGTVDPPKLRALVTAGVNRMSFGVASFNERHLRRLGRDHSAEAARAVVDLARDAGARTVNIDLIFAIPGQTLGEWEADLHEVAALSPDSISAYDLTYEDGTAFHRMREAGRIEPVDEETDTTMFTRTVEILEATGYGQYEISSYARPGHECRHNLSYWCGGDYLGIGAGAHSFGRTPAPGRRWRNEPQPEAYMEKASAGGCARASEEHLTERQARGEFMFLGLRCRRGVDTAAFAERFGRDVRSVFPQAAALERDGLLLRTDRRWQLTRRGLLLADAVSAAFV